MSLAKQTLNNYKNHHQLSWNWFFDTHGVNPAQATRWTSTVTIPSPNGQSVEAKGTATSKKEAENKAAIACLAILRENGFMEGVRDTTADNSDFAAKVALNEFVIRNKLQWEWKVHTASEKEYTVEVSVASLGGVAVGHGTGATRKMADNVAAADCLGQLKSFFSANVDSGKSGGNAVPPSKKLRVAVDVAPPGPCGQAVRPTSASQSVSFRTSGTPATVAVPPSVCSPHSALEGSMNDIGETFGYGLATGKTQLFQYLAKRGLPQDILSEPGAAGYVAWMEVQPSRGGDVVRVSREARSKKDASNMVALCMCVELCRIGEMPAYQSKAQAMEEGIQPCSANLRPEDEDLLDNHLEAFGINMSDANSMSGSFGDAASRASLQPALDASPWAANPDVKEITWEPPVWGCSPWGPKGTVEIADEDVINERLLVEMWNKLENPQYAALMKKKAALPIAPMGDAIVDAIEAHSVTLVSGSTGCGKTTQLPQLLLDRAIMQSVGTRMNIICTQPRRIAAITVAERVAEERGEALGNSVGFCVRFHQILPRNYAAVCYMTTGMLLKKLTTNGLRGVTHLIIDEVHERDLDTDFLLTIVRQLVHKCPEVRVVLMSATMDLAKWSRYFGAGFGAPVEIPGRLFPVTINYVEDVLQLVGMSPGAYSHQKKAQDDDIPVELIERLLERLVIESAKADRGSVLVFLPGFDSISAVQAKLKKNQAVANRIRLHILHSQVPKDEQQAAFLAAPAPLVKVILSTNIAESSVTITDVTVVVDSCRTKQLLPVQSHGGRTAYRLTSTVASKQNLQQRSGRAGRLRAGVCYRLCSRVEYDQLPEHATPEMVRMPLHSVVLTLKSLNLGTAASFLAQAPDPPSLASVRQAVTTLQDIKALDSHENITCVGTLLARLPMDPRLGYSLLAACLMNLEEPMAVLCVMSSSQSPYLNESWRAKDCIASGHPMPSQALLSDHHDMLMTFFKVRYMPSHESGMYCSKNWLNIKVLKHMQDAVDQILNILRQMGLSSHAVDCRWIADVGSPSEEVEQRRNWEALSFLLSLGAEHFAMRRPHSRKVWLGPGKQSTVPVSMGIPEVPPQNPNHPFMIVGELRENKWNSKCTNVSAAGAVATILGAARELRYDDSNQCLVLDGWAPVKLSYANAKRLGGARTMLRQCLLSLSEDPRRKETDETIMSCGALLRQLCDPAQHDA